MHLSAKLLSQLLIRTAAALSMAVLLVTTAAAGNTPGPVDINSATLEQLVALPGIGESKAAAIIEERSIAPFTSVDDLERVKGIGLSTVSELRDRVIVSRKN